MGMLPITHLYMAMLPGTKSLTYAAHSSPEGGMVLNRHSLYSMAEKVLLAAPGGLNITFTGPEPALHPHLQDIIKLFAESGLCKSMTIETGGNQAPALNRRLLSIARTENVNFHIFIDIDGKLPGKALQLAALIANNGFNTRLVCRRSGVTESRNKYIEHIREKFHSVAQIDLADQMEDPREKYSAFRAQDIARDIGSDSASFYCAGCSGYAHVGSGGYLQGLPCGKLNGLHPLWARTEILEPHFVRCSRTGCPAQTLWGIPKLESAEEARDWLQDWRAALKYVPGRHQPSCAVLPEEAPLVLSGLRKFGACLNKISSAGTKTQREELFRQAWQEKGARILAELAAAQEHGLLEQWLDEDVLRPLSGSVLFLQELLAILARLHIKENPSEILQLAPGSAEKIGQPRGMVSLQPFASAENPGSDAPELSIIIVSHDDEGQIDHCLESVFDQVMDDIEIIVIDDASTDASFVKLKAWARNRQNIRLWRSSINCGYGACWNFGLGRVRGQYVIFAGGSHIFRPGFFEDALRRMIKSDAAMGVFSTSAPKGDTMASKDGDALLSSREALNIFLEGSIEPNPWGKIYSMDAIRVTGARFSTGHYNCSKPFLFELLRSSGRILFSPLFVYAHYDVAPSPIQTDYWRLRSSYRFQAFCHRIDDTLSHEVDFPFNCEKEDHCAESAQGNNSGAALVNRKFPSCYHSLENIKNNLIPDAAAWLQNYGIVPIAEDDFELVSKSLIFYRSLLCLVADKLAISRRGRKDMKFSGDAN